MNNYKVVEKFISINGEGSRAGQLAAFIRFHYCNLNCSYCDTRYANDSNSNYELLSAQNILDYLKANKVVNVTLTGGEPLFDKTFVDDLDFDNQEVVVIKDIDIFSYCEHHLALMYDMKVTVAYIPCGKVIGLSKIARIADMAARRLQLQERIGTDIAEIISLVTNSKDIAVIIEGKHSCMSSRGIKKVNSTTVTSTLTGRFKTDSKLQIYLH